MSLQAAVDAWTSRYIKSREASLARLMGALSPPDERRHRLIASLAAAIAAAKRHRVAFGLRLKVKKRVCAKESSR
jgi:hypothetical protein